METRRYAHVLEPSDEATGGDMTTATGHFWFTLRADADEDAFRQLMSALRSEDVLQSMRLTIAFRERLLQVVPLGDGGTGSRPGEYVWEATVDLMEAHPYDFAGCAADVRDAVGDLATLVSVEARQPA